MSRGLYAYVITRDRLPDLVGPWLITHGGLAVVVAEVDLDRFAAIEADEQAEDGPPAVLVREHDAVVRAVFRHEPVLPLRFGTVFPDADAVLRLLSARHEETLTWLNKVEGRREWGVRVRPVCPMTRQLDIDLSGTEYLAMRRRRLTAAENARRDAGLLHDTLARTVADNTFREHSGDLLLDAAYLVDTVGEEDFHAEVRRLTEELGVLVEISGPWPPYSFTRAEFADA